MRFILTLLISWLFFVCHSQNKFFTISESGELIQSSSEDCGAKSYGFYMQFSDIATTPNGSLYAVTDRIYKIDTVLQTQIPISAVLGQTSPAGLVALNEDLLFFDIDDSLFTFSLSNGNKTFIGVIGYYCNGDFAFFDGDLYMISGSNYLIKIVLDVSLGFIESVQNIGLLNSAGLSYSLFTAYEDCDSNVKHLYLIDGTYLYQVNVIDANTILLCNINSGQYLTGATSLNNFISIEKFDLPNVFTPNGDMVNDEYKIDQTQSVLSFSIYNRWGNEVYNWKTGNIIWDGRSDNGMLMNEGVYFYILNYNICDKQVKKTGIITLIK